MKKRSLLKKRQGPVAEKINRRNIEKEQSSVLVIKVHLVAFLFVLLFIIEL